MDRRVVLLVVLVLHLAVAGAHGVTHELVPVRLSPSLNVVVGLTTFLGPIVGVALDWRDHPLGVPVFALSMLGAFVVGGVLHFAVENPDHVNAIPPGTWRTPFRASALAVALTPALGAATGGWYWWRR